MGVRIADGAYGGLSLSEQAPWARLDAIRR
jgi:hypothetical protein